MNTTRRVFKNSTALSLSVLLERGIAFILPWYVARVLGREAWGDFSTAYTFVLIGATLAPWGLVGLLPRQIARDPNEAPNALINGGFIGLVMSGVVSAFVLGLTRLLNYTPQVESLIFVGVITVILPQTEATLFETVIQGLERMEWIVYVRLPATILRVIISILLLNFNFNIGVLFYTLAIYYGLNCIFYLWIFSRHFEIRPFTLHIHTIRLLFIQAMPFFIIISVTETFKQVDRIFLSKLWDTDAVGIYATGTMFIQLLYMLAPALMGALFPGMSRTYVSAPDRFAYLVSWLFKLLAIVIFPVMLFTITFAELSILLVFGDAYEASVGIMRMLAFGILPAFLSRLLYRTILASDNERLAVSVALVGSTTSFILNMLLIPRFGIVGASLAAVGTILVNFGQNFWYVARLIQFDYRHALWKPSLCIALSFGVYRLFFAYNPWLAFLAANICFGVLIWLTGTFGSEDLSNLSLVRNKVS